MAAIPRPVGLAGKAAGRFKSGSLVLGVAAVLVIAVAGLQVNQFSAVTGTGYQIEDLKRERAEKQAANHDQEAEVARLSSLTHVEAAARTKLGMVPATRVEHITITGAVPDHQTLPSRFLPPGRAETDAQEGPSLLDQLLDLLPF
jgi:cell division protein FtsL